MQLKTIDIYRLKIPLCMSFRHHLAEHRFSDNLIVKISTRENVIGFGEGVARDFVTGENISESIAFFKNNLLARLKRIAIEKPSEVRRALSDFFSAERTKQAPALCCALELALLDAAGKRWDMPVANFFGPKDQSLRYSAVLPITDSHKFNELLCLSRDSGMTDVKIKVGDDRDIERLANARNVLGSNVDIRVDANGAWKANEAVLRINEMMGLGISAVEQPVEKNDFEGLHYVAENIRIPIIADESLCGLADAERLVSLGPKVMFNLRLSKCGGMVASDQIYALARSHGILSQLGCQVGETSILAAAGQQFASTHALEYLEGAYSSYLLEEDIVNHPLTFGRAGLAEPPSRPGLGIDVNEEFLERMASSHQAFSV